VLRGLAGLAGVSAIPANGEAGFSFGLTPVVLDNTEGLLEALQDYLTQQLERPVALVKRRSQRETLEMLLSGQLGAAWICDLPYVQNQDSLTVLAVPMYRGRPSCRTYVIVNEKNDAKTFDQLRGTQHAFCDPDSTSGYLVTRWLLCLRNESPGGFFRNFFFTYGHRNTIRAVATGLADSGTVEGYVWDLMKEREPDLIARTRIVYRSEPLGFPPIVAPTRVPEVAAVEALAAALHGMTSDATGREILALLALDGFAPMSPGLYESSAEKWRVVMGQSRTRP
jgi:phosphonate transport system substrate-binding protein